MATERVIRVARDTVKSRRIDRKASEIRTDGYTTALKSELKRTVYINENRGLHL